jgi:hypothetical protein
MATPNYMKRITFLDGQVLHDFHLNIMQKNIAEAIKLKTTMERYDMLLLVSPYNYYFAEPFINTENRDPSSTAQLNPLTFTINADSWVTPVLELPAVTDEIYLLANFEDFPNQNSFVNFYYRTSPTNNWIKVTVDTPIYLPTPSKFIQIKVECTYSGTVRPTVYDFAVLAK